MRINVLSRGGLSVYDGIYDAHRDEAVLRVRTGETAAITIEYPSAPTSPSVVVTGATASSPAITGLKVTLTLSALQPDFRADVTATVGGETRVIRIRGRTPHSFDRYGGPDFIGS